MTSHAGPGATGARGGISQANRRKLRLIVGMQIIWLATAGVLAAWWGTLIHRQALRIVDLERDLARLQGLPSDQAGNYWLRTERMLFWESATFILLILACTGFLAWLYWRETRHSRALEAFFASVTHELRTPLTSIRLQAESIAENLSREPGGLSGSNRSLLERLLEDATRLETQVDRTLELARVEGGGKVLTQPIPLKPWVARAFEIWKSSQSPALQERISVSMELASLEHDTVQADPSAIQVIFRNILENCLRHAQRDKVRLVIKGQTRGDWVQLDFEDDGQGFRGDPNHLGKLFEKGSRSQGAGVGLYLIRALMERMGGKAWFFAAPTGFHVSLWFLQAPDHSGEMASEAAHG